jgi:hypothetical protein
MILVVSAFDMEVNMSARTKRWKIAACISTVAVVTVLAEEIVQVSVLDIRANKGSMYPVVATLREKDKFQILQKQNDGWLLVKARDAEGYVKDTALVPPKGGGFGSGFKGVALGKKEAADPTASNASRGITDGAKFYADAKSYRTDGLEEMLQAAEGVVGQRFLLFTGEANVGPKR